MCDDTLDLLMWGIVALEKASETATGEERFAIRFLDDPMLSLELTERAVRSLFGETDTPPAEIDTMFAIARQVFRSKSGDREGTPRTT